MADLEFKLTDIEREISLAEKYSPRQPNPGVPALLLVGDRGVYILSGHERTEEPPFDVVYAKGLDPRTDKDWFDRKGRVFGYDDGVEFISLEDAKEWTARARARRAEVCKLKMKRRGGFEFVG